MGRKKIRYSEIVDRINIDSLEAFLNWSPEITEGDEDRGFCIFPENHTNGDTTGKFSINREKRIWGCWVCGGGNLLDLVMEANEMDEEDALDLLATLCEDTRTDDDFAQEFLAAFQDAEKRAETLPYFNERVLDKWEEAPDDWLAKRGISREIATEFKLRWADNYRKPHPTGGEFADDPDWVGSGIIFPHFWRDRLVGWQIRWDAEDRPKWVPKYVNTHDFPKETTLYGYESTLAALQAAQKDAERSGAGDRPSGGRNGEIPPVIVCESVPTVLFCLSAGLPAVATFGDTVAGGQLRLLRRFQCGVILAPDNDRAGDHFEAAVKAYLEPFIPVYIAHRVPGEKADLGDLAPDYEALYEWIADTPGL